MVSLQEYRYRVERISLAQDMCSSKYSKNDRMIAALRSMRRPQRMPSPEVIKAHHHRRIYKRRRLHQYDCTGVSV